MYKINKQAKNILQYGFLACLITVTTYLIVSTLDMKLLLKLVNVINYNYIYLGFALMFMYIFLEGFVLRLITNCIHGSETKFLGYKIGIMGLYYNLVTPLASGSQPVQIYELTKSNVSTSKSVAIIANKTVIYQIIVTLYCGALMLVNFNILKTTLKPVLIFICIGMVMNILMLGFGFFIVYSPMKTKKLVNKVLRTLSKIKVLKFLENKEEQLNLFIDEYNYSITLFIKNKRALIKSVILTFIQLTIYFSVTYCIYKSLRLSGASYFRMISLQVFLYMAVSSIPTPGNVGANEVAFFSIFAGIFSKGLMGYSVFLYGMFVYYFLLITCGIFTILSHGKVFSILKKYCNLNRYVSVAK